MSWRNWDWIKALTESAEPADTGPEGRTQIARDNFFYGAMKDEGYDPDDQNDVNEFIRKQNEERERRGVDGQNYLESAADIANPELPHEHA